MNMPKKSKKTQAENPADNESKEQPAELAETTSADAQREAPGSDSNESSQVENEPSMDDLMEDVRRSLMEEESEADEKKPKLWNRLTKVFHKDQNATEAASPAEDELSSVPATEKAKAEDAYVDQIDELINMLDTDATPVAPETQEPAETPIVQPIAAPPPPPPPEPEPQVDVQEMKKRLFDREPGSPVAEEELSQVRQIALEGGEDVFVEVEAAKTDAAQDRLKSFENTLRPYFGYIYWVTALVGVIMVVVVGAVMVRLYQQSRPPEPTKVASNLPYPATMILPGDLSFNLGKGAIKDGEWNPRGPEWLEGTEICRWVAIPWSLQLEAVVRTFTQKDTIQLVMSNNDKLAYNVYSIQQLTLEEMQALDQNSPCLLLVLAKQDSEKRWVVTAKP
jgi:hypothetical protein